MKNYTAVVNNIYLFLVTVPVVTFVFFLMESRAIPYRSSISDLGCPIGFLCTFIVIPVGFFVSYILMKKSSEKFSNDQEKVIICLTIILSCTWIITAIPFFMLFAYLILDKLGLL